MFPHVCGLVSDFIIHFSFSGTVHIIDVPPAAADRSLFSTFMSTSDM